MFPTPFSSNPVKMRELKIRNKKCCQAFIVPFSEFCKKALSFQILSCLNLIHNAFFFFFIFNVEFNIPTKLSGSHSSSTSRKFLGSYTQSLELKYHDIKKVCKIKFSNFKGMQEARNNDGNYYMQSRFCFHTKIKGKF